MKLCWILQANYFPNLLLEKSTFFSWVKNLKIWVCNVYVTQLILAVLLKYCMLIIQELPVLLYSLKWMIERKDKKTKDQK